ncbi:MAG: 7-cyano-7-deazaguanine synthase [Caldisericia bacterium]|nr:7-cyano-7-deazaguanine synthase [Caldisericia bacterium]
MCFPASTTDLDRLNFKNIKNLTKLKFLFFACIFRFIVYSSSSAFANFAYEMPFKNMTKAEVLQTGSQLNVDFAKTWSCLSDGENHCGTCDGCNR